MWFGPVPVHPLPLHDHHHTPTPHELVRLSATNRDDFHGSFGAEAFALGCLLNFTSRHPHPGSDTVVSNCSSVLAIAHGRARSRGGGLSALLRLLEWNPAASLRYCPSHLEYPLNQFAVPFSWGSDSGLGCLVGPGFDRLDLPHVCYHALRSMGSVRLRPFMLRVTCGCGRPVGYYHQSPD